MRSMANPVDRQDLLERLGRLRPDTQRLWGKMDAPRMIAHLTDQMRHTLGDVRATPVSRFRRIPAVRWLAIYVLPWPKGIPGPAEAFVTQPEAWETDLAALCGLVLRFPDHFSRRQFGEHPFFGNMSPEMWGDFCYRHFEHHLRQFGV